MASIKKLANETVIYGVSTILARVLNYMLFPLYTRVISPENYGIYSELLAYVTLLQVALTFGLETGFFRFANRGDKDPNDVLSTALVWVSFLSFLFFALASASSFNIASLMGRAESAPLIVLIAAILCFDCITAILFARLRFLHKAIRFSTFKVIKILAELGFNFLFFFTLPVYFINHPNSILLNFLTPVPDYSYIIFAIFLSSLVPMLLFLPSLFKLRFRFIPSLWKEMMLYSIPIMMAGLPGVANDFIDRILFRFFAPTPPSWESQLGLFSGNVKLAVIMSLFVQMFRYAAEPFFFASAKEEDIRKTYAKVMKYFSVFCIFIFLFVTLNIDLIGLLLGKDFRSAIDIVPIMLMAYVLLGVAFNLSMCFKLTGKTHYTIYITLAGLTVTLLINVVFMPVYGYYAAAWGHLLSYLVMVVISWLMGRKIYPIPYRWGDIAIYFGVGLLLYFSFRWLNSAMLVGILQKSVVSLLFLAVFLVFFIKKENISLVAIASRLIKRG